MKSVWLELLSDKVAGIASYSQCIQLIDLKGEGEFNLVIVDPRSKQVREYKGNNINWETSLIETPCGISYFYPEHNRVPSLAIAGSSSIFIFRH